MRLARELGIAVEVDLAGAGRRAALDLIEQARPRARLEETVRAGAQEKGALQRIDGAVDRAGGGERSVIAAGPRARAAVLQNLRRPVVGGDQDIGKRLVVAQEHVEARAQALDQIGFEQQRLGLGRGGDEFERYGGADHARDARVIAGRPRIGGEPLFDALGLADIEHLALGVDHAIDAGRGRRELEEAHDGRAPGGQRAGRRVLQLELGQRLLLVVLGEVALRVDVAFAVHAFHSVIPGPTQGRTPESRAKIQTLRSGSGFRARTLTRARRNDL